MARAGTLHAFRAGMTKNFPSRRLSPEVREQPDAVVLVPGWNDSGPDHWQSLWETLLPRSRRVRQRNWQVPVLEEWLVGLEMAIRAADSPVVLVGHSLGCILLAHYFDRVLPLRGQLRGALLVAPVDVESEERVPRILREFGPIPTRAFRVPTIVVGSRNDPYMSLERARRCARHWHAEFVDLGFVGHINVDSDLGAFVEGLNLLSAFTTQGPIAYQRATEDSWGAEMSA